MSPKRPILEVSRVRQVYSTGRSGGAASFHVSSYGSEKGSYAVQGGQVT